MSERLPQPIDPEYKLFGFTPDEWHHWLTTDPRTGESAGHLETPGSRYGSTSEQCAWWAVADLSIAQHQMEIDDAAQYIDQVMGFYVNNFDHLEDWVRENADLVPPSVREKLDLEGEVA